MANVVHDLEHAIRFTQVSAVCRVKNKTLLVHVMSGAGLQAIQWEFENATVCTAFYDALILAMNT